MPLNIVELTIIMDSKLGMHPVLFTFSIPYVLFYNSNAFVKDEINIP